MVTTTDSWAWFGTGTWPGYSASNDNNLGSNGNGKTVSPDAYHDITWYDGNNDGVITDTDKNDAGVKCGDDTGGNYTGTNDGVLIDGVFKSVHEVGQYLNSTVVIDGVTHHVPVVVWIFDDGTWMARINDADIPAGINHTATTSIKLGSWDGTEYSGSYVATRDDPFICFRSGTLIETALGERRVEGLIPGDLVLTADHGLQPLRWIGSRTLSGLGRMAPIRVAAGALGNRRDLWLSPQHRLLVSDWRAQLFAGEEEVLVSACHLLQGDLIHRDPMERVTYVHLLFDQHEIVFSEGIPSESFHPGSYGLGLLSDAVRDELLELFPEMDAAFAGFGQAARTCLTGQEARLVLGRPPARQGRSATHPKG